MDLLLLTLSIYILSTKPAQAYLDPGTGSYLLQLIIGGALGGMFLLKNYWHTLTSFLSRKKSVPVKNETKDEEK